uniref:phosphopyruvate hydratase n=1 Tax=Glossina palpalis gambiensis TaxID=67801 RepID=A0A1B0APT2_9MUSC
MALNPLSSVYDCTIYNPDCLTRAGRDVHQSVYSIVGIRASSFTEAMKMGSEVYHHLKKVINDKFGLDATAVGDEGGFAPNIQSNKEALCLIKDAIELAAWV